MSTLQELLAQQQKLEQQISQLRNTERSDAIAKVQELMQTHGLTVDDLEPASSRTPKERATKGTRVAAKYKDDQNNAWSGRGLKPKWLQAALAAGKTLDDFRV